MGRWDNLKPWPKSVSGNPGGRPKTKLITDELVRLVRGGGAERRGQSWATVITQALLRQAIKADVRAIADDCGSELFERKHRVPNHDSVDADVHSICSNSQSRSSEVVDVLA